MSAQILILVRDSDLQEQLQRSLRPAGYVTAVLAEPSEATLHASFQCVLVEHGLWPSLRGVLADLSLKSSPKVLVLAAEEAQTARDADDVMIWPVKSNELQLRIEAQFRGLAQPDRVLRLEDCLIDLARARVYRPSGTLTLDETEQKFVETLVAEPDRLHRWNELAQALYPDDLPQDGRRKLANMVRDLTPKVEANPSDPRHILTAFGVGYRFVVDPPALTNLNPAPSSFIGRTTELGNIEDALNNGASEIWVVGPAGMGKTRLCREFGLSRSDSAFPGGVWYCDLSHCQYISDVTSELAMALRVPVASATTVHDASAWIGRAILARGPTLVILDNLDAVAFKLARALAAWLESCPELRFLCIARNQRVATNDTRAEIRLGPLGPDDALQLAMRRQQSSTATIPMAIELGGGAEDVDPVIDAIERKWSDLDDSTQQVLVCASVFAQGFTAPALAEVARADEVPIDVLPAIEQLLASGLVRSFDPATRRWGLPQAVGDFARKRLAEREDHSDVSDRHTTYFVAFARQLAQTMTRSGGAEAAARLRREHGNLAVAYARSVDSNPAQALEIVLAWQLDRGWNAPMDVQQDRLDRLLERASRIPPTLRAHGRLSRAKLRLEQERYEAVTQDLQYATDVATAQQDDLILAECNRVRHAVDYALGRPAMATRHLDQCRRLAASHPDATAIARQGALAEVASAQLKFDEGRVDEAEQELFVAEAVLRQVGDPAAMAEALFLAGRICAIRLDYPAAEVRLGEAHELWSQLQWREQQADALLELGATALVSNELEDAEASLGRAQYLYLRTGRDEKALAATAMVGVLRHRQLQFGEAEEAYTHALRGLPEAPLRHTILAYRAAVLADLDRLDEANELLHAVESIAQGSPQLSTLAAICKLHSELAVSRSHLAQANKDGAAAALDHVMENLIVLEGRVGVATSLADRLSYPGFAASILRAILDFEHTDTAGPAPPAS